MQLILGGEFGRAVETCGHRSRADIGMLGVRHVRCRDVCIGFATSRRRRVLFVVCLVFVGVLLFRFWRKLRVDLFIGGLQNGAVVKFSLIRAVGISRTILGPPIVRLVSVVLL